MRFVVRNVRFDLFLLENSLICAVTAWGAPELGQVVPFHCPAVEMLTKSRIFVPEVLKAVQAVTDNFRSHPGSLPAKSGTGASPQEKGAEGGWLVQGGH